MGKLSGGLGQVARRGVKGVAVTVGCLTFLVAPSALASSAPVASPIAGAARVAAAQPNATVSLALPLKADGSGLERFATAVSTPGSPEYGRYESIGALAKRFGAPAAERARVLHFLRRAGAARAAIDVTGLFADTSLKVSVAERLFGTSLADFRTARAARFMAPDAPARIPAGLRSSVNGVVGLDTRPLFGSAPARPGSRAVWPQPPARPDEGAVGPHAPARAQPTATPGTEHADDESGYTPRTGTPSGCTTAVGRPGFTPNQYLTAYNYAPLQRAGFLGQGERVALIEIDGFRLSDLRTFAKCFQLSIPAINGHAVGLKHPLAPGGESTLDLEVLTAAAPRLKGVDVYESRPNAVDVLDSLTAPLAKSASRPDVISVSLGSCERATLDTIGSSGLRAVEGSLAMAAADGISVLAASGDDGSSACQKPSGQPVRTLAVSFPASSPWVTGVGGTNIALDPANQILAQQVWNDSPLVIAAGGGGVSSLFGRPAYQDPLVASNHRTVPDVSMLADVAPGFEIYCTAEPDCVGTGSAGPWSEVGGTSAASPLLAGGLALVDQVLRAQDRQNVGLANPMLYAIARSPGVANVISDVADNDNDLGASLTSAHLPLGCCTAGPGYDDASGLGSVNLTGLASAAGSMVPRFAAVDVALPWQRHPVASRHLMAQVSCSARCLMGAYARFQIGRSPRRITERSGMHVLSRGGRATIPIDLTSPALDTLRRALGRHDPVTATVYGAILDPGGAVDVRTRGERLRVWH